MNLNAQKDLASKALYAALGAPVVAGRKVREYGTRVTETAQDQFETFADEGEKVAGNLRSRHYVEELQSRLDMEKVQGRVDRMRDQLEATLTNWRDSFAPPAGPGTEAPARSGSAPGKAPATKKAPAKKATGKKTTASKAPAAKATATKKPASTKKAAPTKK